MATRQMMSYLVVKKRIKTHLYNQGKQWFY